MCARVYMRVYLCWCVYVWYVCVLIYDRIVRLCVLSISIPPNERFTLPFPAILSPILRDGCHRSLPPMPPDGHVKIKTSQ